ncbi:MAG: hypothetical protein ABSG46_00425 [Candidatus Binataceae bacterium]|jgi:hypothetical protein
MKAELLHVVTAIFNPIGWGSRVRLYSEFEKHMLASGVRLTTVECVLGDRPHVLGGEPGVNYVPVRANTLLWNKENLINIGISRLPEDWKYVAWIDADIKFRRPDWAAATINQLQQYEILQPWSDCYDLGPVGQHVEHHRSFCRQWWLGAHVGGGGCYTFAHPGYAWAATRSAIDALGGLVETAAVGAGDHHMALALVGKVKMSVPGGVTAGYMRPLIQWQQRAGRHINENIGYLDGSTIEHSWHGRKDDRKYVQRWDIITRNEFDPDSDLKRNIWGVLELAGNKPNLRHDVDGYFRQRNEDANAI